jgi:predicted AlkP superfamily pyrophosphatase or phosphodiesterase
MKGESIGFVSLARIPTVTKPCLKSIFAGTHPVFFEIVENIDESGVTETVQSSTVTSKDNLLQRLQGNNKKISVYGDDVWGKLFPMSTFHRHDLAFGFNIMVIIMIRRRNNIKLL